MRHRPSALSSNSRLFNHLTKKKIALFNSTPLAQNYLHFMENVPVTVQFNNANILKWWIIIGDQWESLFKGHLLSKKKLKPVTIRWSSQFLDTRTLASHARARTHKHSSTHRQFGFRSEMIKIETNANGKWDTEFHCNDLAKKNDENVKISFIPSGTI